MPAPQRRPRARHGLEHESRKLPRGGSVRLLPLGVLAAVAAFVVLLVVLSAGGTEGDAPAATGASDAASGGSLLTPATPPASSAAGRATLLERGRRLVRPVDRRPAAAPIRLRTAPFGDGTVFDLAEERGNVVVLFFMAAWCYSCLPEARALAQIHEQYAGQGVRVFTLDVDATEDEGDLARFREQTGNGRHLWAMDVDNDVARTYEVLSLDTTIFIDREGRVACTDGSPTTYDVLVAVIEALL